MKRASYALVAAVLAASWAGAEDVIWANPVGVSITGSSLQKTGGTAAWNAGAASNQVIRDGYGYAEFVATETTTSRACGPSIGDQAQTLVDIDYAVHLQPSGQLRFFQPSGQAGGSFTYAAGDRLRVELRCSLMWRISCPTCWRRNAQRHFRRRNWRSASTDVLTSNARVDQRRRVTSESGVLVSP